MAKGDDSRNRQQILDTSRNYYNQQGPMTSTFAYNYGRGSEREYGDYNDIMNRYRNLAGGGSTSSAQGQPIARYGGSTSTTGGISPSRESIMGLFQGGMLTPETLRAAQPQLSQMGIHLQNERRGDLRPRMLMPDGNTVDLGDWGGQVQWQERGNLGNWHQDYEDILAGRRPEIPGGGHSSSSQFVDPSKFASYGGYQSFANDGGYSSEDMANLRARALSPIRAAYSNAEREVQRQRSLQGGYAPNAIATLAKMARERGQAGSDATIDVEGSIVDARNRNKLAGLGGMFGVESLQNQNELEALRGMSSLYGTTPGMASTFGNQLLQSVGQGGQFGNNMINSQIDNSRLPGDWDYFTDRVGDVAGMIYPWLEEGN